MTPALHERATPPRHRWHPALWAAAALLLLAPAIAMRVGVDGVHWTASDFIVMGVLLTAATGAYEVAARMSGDTLVRAGFAAAVLGGLLQVWADLAVGLVADGANLPNLLFMGVVGVAVVGTLLARLRPARMVGAMLATAAIHVLVGIVTAIAGWGAPVDDALHVLAVTAVFATPWLASALLFRLASRGEARG